MPQSSKQWRALLSRADELYYGGAAGGGKTDLIIGMAIECHTHSAIFRRVQPNLREIIRRSRELLSDAPEWKENKTDKIWTRDDGNTIEFGAVQHEDDKTNWQGRPHDLKAFDEIPEFTLTQYLFITGWTRTTDPGQRVRVIATGNPPLDESGHWILERWGAWLNPDHSNPAAPGELRWYATVKGQEREFDNGDPVEIEGETVYPRSRTFIPARLEDNPYYAHDARYISVLQSLPEPLRSMLLYGDFQASATPNPFQVIPSEWVRLAQKRWLERERPNVSMSALGVDPSRGGRDEFTLAPRFDDYFDEITAHPGSAVKDGAIGSEMIVQVVGDHAPAIYIDVIGIGSSVYDHTKDRYNLVIPINAAAGSEYRDISGKYKMRNFRAEMYWRMRDALNPKLGSDYALPPGNEILADLCSARYKVSASGVLIEEKDEIKKRIGRSPDKGEALLLANLTPSTLPDQPQQKSKWISEGDQEQGSKWSM